MLSTLMFLGAEAMFFAGLIGAYIVFQVGSAMAAAVSAAIAGRCDRVNTLILIASAVTMRCLIRGSTIARC